MRNQYIMEEGERYLSSAEGSKAHRGEDDLKLPISVSETVASEEQRIGSTAARSTDAAAKRLGHPAAEV